MQSTVLPVLLLVLSHPWFCQALEESRSSSGAIHLPIYRRDAARPHKREVGALGLGDYQDVAYNILVKIGNTSVPLVLDTGSSDLWALSDSCKGNCSSDLPVYPHRTLKYSGADVRLFYGDSATGTFAFGPIGKDTVSLGGLNMTNQYFAAINQTDTEVVQTGAVGLFGLGFPINSIIWNELFNLEFPTKSGANSTTTSHGPQKTATKSPSKRSSFGYSFNQNRNWLARLRLAALDNARILATVDQLLSTFVTHGPLIARMSANGTLTEPSVTITLQRNSLDIGGNVGMLSIGQLPPNILNNTLTWTGIRRYTSDQGGIPPPASAPTEIYPIAWEVPIDDVYLDGKVLPQSKLSTGVSLTALIDTGNSLIRGPKDVVTEILTRVTGSATGTTYDCSVPHTLEFQIGGKRFPIDARDFGWEATGGTGACTPNVVGTDPPSRGFLYAWSLGDPFLKSVLASFYYGNLTHPSIDPPRIGFLSTVPKNAADLLKAAAKNNPINFPVLHQAAPSNTYTATTTGVGGVLLAPVLPTPTVTTSSALPISSHEVSSTTVTSVSGKNNNTIHGGGIDKNNTGIIHDPSIVSSLIFGGAGLAIMAFG